MLNFCKRKFLHSFLSFSNYSSEDRYRKFHSMDSGLSLIVGDCPRPDNVLESTAVKPIRRKKISNSGNYGYCSLDEIISGGGGNGVNGLMSCTESLGFESSDQMEKELEDDDDDHHQMVEVLISKPINDRSRWRRFVDRDELMENKKKKVFPPPLSSMNRNGKPNFFLRPVRKDGRLELTEVRINRPDQIFRACRQDGRLRLHFNIVPQLITQEEEEIEEESSSVRELKFPLTSGEGFRWCHELSNHHHHHHHTWNQHHHQVTTRSTVHVL
ncbi:The fantastic four family [Macleaya cordata]|uniref:The fantastic four family n=1 Tax=Macleaya cordata TaxID=56857 RepID=A0A200Q6V5_MACCD|nr:The fantastic four family [Macleaya cordata]